MKFGFVTLNDSAVTMQGDARINLLHRLLAKQSDNRSVVKQMNGIAVPEVKWYLNSAVPVSINLTLQPAAVNSQSTNTLKKVYSDTSLS